MQQMLGLRFHDTVSHRSQDRFRGHLIENKSLGRAIETLLMATCAKFVVHRLTFYRGVGIDVSGNVLVRVCGALFPGAIRRCCVDETCADGAQDKYSEIRRSAMH
jgi:hypothetical protein